MIAIIKTGGKQYKVRENQVIKVEKLIAEKDSEFIFDQVLLVADEAGADLKIGAPIVPNANVKAKVLEHGRSDKVSVVKYKSKTRYHKRVGHRQPFTKLEVVSINV